MARKIDWLLWILFSLWLIVDCITGFGLNNGVSLPVSQGIKFIILLLLILRVCQKKRLLIFTLITFGYLAILVIFSGAYNRDIVLTLTHLSKLLSTIYIYLYFLNSIKVYRESFNEKANRILKIGFIVIVFNISIGFMGFGYHTYPTTQIGYKGFFYAGNELGGVIAAIFPFILYVAFWNLSRFKYYFLALTILIISIGIGTKTVMLTCFIFTFAIPWLYGDKLSRRKIIIAAIIIGLPSCFIIAKRLIDSDAGIIVKLTYNYNTKGLMGLVFSGRDEFWENKSIEFYNSSPTVQLFGLGESQTVEMDSFDALLNYGWLGLTTLIFLYSFLIVSAYRAKRNNSFIKTLILQDWCLMCMSLLAGHIVFSSMAGLYIALINSLIYINKDNRKCLVELRKRKY